MAARTRFSGFLARTQYVIQTKRHVCRSLSVSERPTMTLIHFFSEAVLSFLQAALIPGMLDNHFCLAASFTSSGASQPRSEHTNGQMSSTTGLFGLGGRAAGNYN